MNKIYTLSRLKQNFITNTDGTISGTFDEIFSIIDAGQPNTYHITTDMMGCEIIIATFEKNKESDDLILITYLENDTLS
jgi:hypothetical protein